MPEVEKLLPLLWRAATLNRATPGRRGQIVHIETGGDLLVSGDLHGNVANFRKVLSAADLEAHPQRHLVLQELVHGPLRYPPRSPEEPDGGDTSHQLVDLFAALKGQYPDRVHWLLGNHELAEFSGRRITKGQGAQTPLFRRGVEHAYGARADEMMEAYRALFASLPLAARTPNGVFVSHSIPSVAAQRTFDRTVFDFPSWPQEAGRPGSAVYELVWGREFSQQAADAFAHLVGARWLITGHERAPEGFAAPNTRQLVLDTSGDRAAVCVVSLRAEFDHETLLRAVRML